MKMKTMYNYKPTFKHLTVCFNEKQLHFISKDYGPDGIFTFTFVIIIYSLPTFKMNFKQLF